MDPTALASNVLVGALVIVAAALTLLAVRAGSYARDRRTLLLAVAFGLLLAKGLLILWALFALPAWTRVLPEALGLDLAALVAFYFASLR